MKLRSYEVFYKRVRCLFPNVGTKEGRFLKELKAHLQDFSLVHPNVTYEEIVDFFGTPEEIMKNYIEAEGIENVSKRITTRKHFRIVICIICMLVFFMCGIFLSYWKESYQNYSTDVPVQGEVHIEEGVIEP